MERDKKNHNFMYAIYKFLYIAISLTSHINFV